MKNVVVAELIRRLQDLYLRRTDDALIHLPRITLTLYILYAVVYPVQSGLREEPGDKKLDILLNLHPRRMQLLREALRESCETLIVLIVKIQSDADDLKRREDIIKGHYLIPEELLQALHIL